MKKLVKTAATGYGLWVLFNILITAYRIGDGGVAGHLSLLFSGAPAALVALDMKHATLPAVIVAGVLGLLQWSAFAWWHTRSSSVVLRAIWNLKSRLLDHDFVANPRNSGAIAVVCASSWPKIHRFCLFHQAHNTTALKAPAMAAISQGRRADALMRSLDLSNFGGGAPVALISFPPLKKLLAPIVFAVASAAAGAEPVLLGQWKSDRALTLQFNKERVKLEDRTLSFLSQIMGRMTVTFSKTNVTYEMKDWEFEAQTGEKRLFNGFLEVLPYRQIGHTPKSVAIHSRAPVTGEERITVINFVGPDTIWIYSGHSGEAAPSEHLREYFVRQRP